MDSAGTWKRFKVEEVTEKPKGMKPIFKGVIEDYKGKTYVSIWPTDTFENYIKKVLGVS